MKFNLILIITLAFSGMSYISDAAPRSSSSRSYSRSYSPKPTIDKTKATTLTKPTDSRFKSKPNNRVASKVDKASYEKAVKNGTQFKTRSDAVKDFKSKNASKYSSRYAKEPASRPQHIPRTTQSGGNTYNINYNQSAGGYGFTNALGAFIIYDMMTDAAMTNRMMANQGYHYGTIPHSGISVLAAMGISIVLALIFTIAIISCKLS